MKVVIAGAGSVGRSVARELLDNGHQVTLIEHNKSVISHNSIPGAKLILADACEPGGLDEANVENADIVVAATGDDKTNVVLSLLAKTEFSVPRTIGRVNNPRNEWLFDANWGVDVAVSMPRLMTALVEEAVEVGGLVTLLSLQQGRTALLEYTVGEDTSVAGTRLGRISWPHGAVLVAIVRNAKALAPSQDDVIEVGDELFFLSPPELHDHLRTVLTEKQPSD